MEQVVSRSAGQETADQQSADSKVGAENIQPLLKELDKLKLERLNLFISNLNLQLALLNERARALQIETAGLRVEREGLVNNITLTMMANNEIGEGWRLNPDAMTFEQTPNVGAGLAPAQEGK